MIIMQNLIESPEKLTYGREGWYFAENGEHLHYDLITRIGKDLFELGVLESAEPAVFKTEEEVVEGAKKVCSSLTATRVKHDANYHTGAIQRGERHECAVACSPRAAAAWMEADEGHQLPLGEHQTRGSGHHEGDGHYFCIEQFYVVGC